MNLFVCKVCDKYFRSPEQVALHIRNVHRVIKKPERGKWIQKVVRDKELLSSLIPDGVEVIDTKN